MSGDFDFEPVRGLPEQLPDGERVLWRGAPDYWSFAKRVFHIRKVMFYFSLLVAWRVFVTLQGGGDHFAAVIGVWPIVVAGFAALAILGGLAWVYSKTTVYTMTDKRLVIRSGVALPVTFNLPLSRITNAGFSGYSDMTGDIAIELDDSAHVAYLHLWPNVRPWHIRNPQPALRCTPDAAVVANTLKSALEVVHKQTFEDRQQPVAGKAPGRKSGSTMVSMPALAHKGEL